MELNISDAIEYIKYGEDETFDVKDVYFQETEYRLLIFYTKVYSKENKEYLSLSCSKENYNMFLRKKKLNKLKQLCSQKKN